MTGYNSKRQMAKAKLDDDDDTQVYADTLLIVYQRGFADGKRSAQRPWVGLTDDEIDIAWRSVDYTVPYSQFRIDIAKAIEAKIKEKNT